MEAIPDLKGVDQRIADSAEANGFSRRLPADARPLSRGEAGKIAVASSTALMTEAESSVVPKAAVRVPYALAAGWIHDSNQLIAPSRCVWVVTVEAPFKPNHTLRGHQPKTYDRYTMVFDAASGEGISLSAGPDEPDVMSGANINALR